MDLNTLISQYGYAALVIGSLAEGETVTLLGGVAAHQGLLRLFLPDAKTDNSTRLPQYCCCMD